MHTLPSVVIVGRPNVGKSTLFNRLIGQRKAIVSSQPGTTRDRLFATMQWNNRSFRLVDTAGLFFDPYREISSTILDQISIAIADADILVFVLNIRDGILPADEEVAQLLRRQDDKPVLLVANQADHAKHEQELYSCYNLGCGEPFPLSALSGRRTGDLLDAIVAALPEENPEHQKEHNEEGDSTAIALVGRPNVGKSTLLNTLIGDDLVVVSDVPGTTRDAIDVTITRDGKPYTLIDTAGMRRKGKIGKHIEYYSVLRALAAIERSDVVLLLFDVAEGLTHQDTVLLGEAIAAKKGILLVANKWDILLDRAREQGEVTETLYQDVERIIRREIPFAPWMPITMLSAKTGKRLPTIWQHIDTITELLGTTIPTGALSERLLYWKQQAPLPAKRGQALRIMGVKQTDTHPPRFTFRVNDPQLVHFSYQRFLERQLRSDFDLGCVPITLEFKRAHFKK